MMVVLLIANDHEIDIIMKRLDVYIYDYIMKRTSHASAMVFQLLLGLIKSTQKPPLLMFSIIEISSPIKISRLRCHKSCCRDRFNNKGNNSSNKNRTVSETDPFNIRCSGCKYICKGSYHRQTFHGTQIRNQQISVSAQDIRIERNSMMNTRANLNGSNLTLNGWPLTGFDQIRSGILQQQKSLVSPSHAFRQLPLQQQLLLQAQCDLASQYARDVEVKKL